MLENQGIFSNSKKVKTQKFEFVLDFLSNRVTVRYARYVRVVFYELIEKYNKMLLGTILVRKG